MIPDSLPMIGGPVPKLIAAKGAPAAGRFLNFLTAEIAIASEKSTPLFRALDLKRRLTERPLRPKKALAMIKR